MQSDLFDDIDDLLEESKPQVIRFNDKNQNTEQLKTRTSIPDIEPDVLDKVDEYIRSRNDLFSDETTDIFENNEQFEFIPNTNRIEYNQPECVICSDGLISLDEDFIGYLDICNHIFCFKCIIAWANRTNCCPLCKRKFGHIRKLSKSDLSINAGKISFIQNSGDVILVDDRSLQSQWEQHMQETGCEICGNDNDWDSMLLCDECDNGFHLYCLNPPLSNVPPGLWFCNSCIDNNPTLGNAITQIPTSNGSRSTNRNSRFENRLPESDSSFSDFNHSSNGNSEVDLSDLSNISIPSNQPNRSRFLSSGIRTGNTRPRGRPRRDANTNSNESKNNTGNSNRLNRNSNRENSIINGKKPRKSRSDKGKKRKKDNLTPIQALGRSFRIGTNDSIVDTDSISAMFNRERALTSRLLNTTTNTNMPRMQNATESRLLRFMNYEFQKNSTWN